MTTPQHNQNRDQGGRFADGPHDEVDLDGPLAGEPPELPKVVKAREPGVWGVASTQTKTVSIDGADIISRDPAGIPELRARHLAAGAIMAEHGHGDTWDAEAKVTGHCEAGGRMTVLVQDTTGTVRAIEGTGVPAEEAGERHVVKAKGSTSSAYRLGPAGRLLKVTSAYGCAQDLSDDYQTSLRTVPELGPATTSGIPPAGPGAPPSAIAAAYLVEGPAEDTGGNTAGCVFLATDYDAENDIVSGYFWAPGDSGLYSESSSMYGSDLLRRGGRVEGYEPGSLSFGDAVDGRLGTTRTVAYERLLGR
jgi:hypothetical protein